MSAPAPCGEGRAHDGRAVVVAAHSMRDSTVTMRQLEHVEELVVNLLDQDGATAALRTARQVGSRERSCARVWSGRTRTARVRRSRRESKEGHLKLEHSGHGTCVRVAARSPARRATRRVSKVDGFAKGGIFQHSGSLRAAAHR